MSARGAVFVDRDGVINALVPDPVSGRPESPLHVAEVKLLEGVPEALRRLQAGGWPLVGVSNQPAAAKGLVSLAEVQAVQAAVLQLLRDAGIRFADFQLCLHHPDAVVPDLRGPCTCRKPQPGMLLAAAERLQLDLAASWMIGDTDADMLAGQAAGCRTVLVENRGSAHKRGGHGVPGAFVPDLTGAVDIILAGKE